MLLLVGFFCALTSPLPLQDSPVAPVDPVAVTPKPSAQAVEIGAVLEGFLKKHKSKVRAYPSEDGRFTLYSDFSRKSGKKAFSMSGEILARLDACLGAPQKSKEGPFSLLLLRNEKHYSTLCNGFIEGVPSLAGFFLRQRNTTGFTLYAPRLSVFLLDPKGASESDPYHDIAHNAVHLDMHQRYGVLPLWLTEGMACAAEDSAFGSVWAHWYRTGFIFSKSHGAWRGKETQALVASAEKVHAVFGYGARPFQPELAKLAFAVATFGLESDPAGLDTFCKHLNQEYQRRQKFGGRFTLEAEVQLGLASAAFGADFVTKLQDWWENPASWKAWKKKKR